MTNTGRALDSAARARAEAVSAAIRARGKSEVHHEHTREVVRQDIPAEIIDLIRQIAKRQADVEARVAALETAVAMLTSARTDEQVAELRGILADLAREARRAVA
jgi:hypothetical protein